MKEQDEPVEDELGDIEERLEEQGGEGQQADGEVSISEPPHEQEPASLGVRSAKPLEAPEGRKPGAARKCNTGRILCATGKMTLVVALLLSVSGLLAGGKRLAPVFDWVMGTTGAVTVEPITDIPMRHRVLAATRKCLRLTRADYHFLENWITFKDLRSYGWVWRHFRGLRAKFRNIVEVACTRASGDAYGYNCGYRITEPELHGERSIFFKASEFQCFGDYQDFAMNFTVDEKIGVVEFPEILVGNFKFVSCIWKKSSYFIEDDTRLRAHMESYFEAFLKRNFSKIFRACLKNTSLKDQMQDSTTVTHRSSQRFST